MDFYLTSDKKLAAVHDWHQFGNKDDVALSSDEWKKFKAYGSPETPSRFTTMLVGDVLDQMVINQDMVLITDTKIDGNSQRRYDHSISRHCFRSEKARQGTIGSCDSTSL